MAEIVYYTGVGSRNAPASIISLMMAFSAACAEGHYILRSGGANGADRAFEDGADIGGGRKEIFLPYRGFNGSRSTLYMDIRKPVTRQAMAIASSFHENWNALEEKIKLFHARNVFQVLGSDLMCPSRFLVCWTPDGKESGGTRTAIRLAKAKGIKVYNLHNPRVLELIELWTVERAFSISLS